MINVALPKGRLGETAYETPDLLPGPLRRAV